MKELPAGQVLNPTVLKLASNTAADSDIRCRTSLLIDCDPIRPAKTNSTDAEKAASHTQAFAVREFLRARGWPSPVLADSGNGTQLRYAIDLPNDDSSRDTVRHILARLATLFDTEQSKVDRGNFNAARVCKLYPSWTRKGPHSDERPHRRSAILECPTELFPVLIDLLDALAAEFTKAQERKSALTLSADVKVKRLAGFLEHYGIDERSAPRRVKGGWAIGILCPWADEHSDESNRDTEVSYIPGIGNGFKCFHSHCADRHWKEVRLEIEKRNPSLPAYFGKSKLPQLVHSEIARSFLESTEDLVCVYDQEADTGVWVQTRWAIGDPKDNLLRRAIRDYLDQLYPLYPELPAEESRKGKADPRRTLLQSPFLNYVLAEVRPLLPKKSIQDFDADPWLLAVPDGQVIELSTGELRPMRREDCITRRINVTPDAGQPTPRWDEFLREITVNDADLADYLVRLCGLCLSGHPEQVLVFFWGKGRNGKGVVLRLLAKILGDFATSLRPAEITYSRNGGDNMKRTFAKLSGKRLAVMIEAPGKRLNYEMLKVLSGGDALSGARMRQDDKEQPASHKCVFQTNERPNIPADPAWRGRLHFVPFKGDFSGEKGDRFIEEKLWSERAGILHKLIRGCVDAKEHGLRPPKVVLDATADLMEEMDLCGQFIADHCQNTGLDTDFVKLSDIEASIRKGQPGFSGGQ